MIEKEMASFTPNLEAYVDHIPAIKTDVFNGTVIGERIADLESDPSAPSEPFDVSRFV